MFEQVSVASGDGHEFKEPSVNVSDLALKVIKRRKVGRPKKNVSSVEEHYEFIIKTEPKEQEKKGKKRKVGRPRNKRKLKYYWELDPSKKVKKYARCQLKQSNDCQLCEKKFKTPALLRRHMTVHNNERPFTCDICDKTYSQLAHLKRHIPTHFNVPFKYKCSQCPANFAQKVNLKSHISKIHPDNEEASSDLLSCEFCNAKFRRRQHLHMHQLRLHLNKEEPDKLSDTLDDVMDNLKRMSEQIHDKEDILAKAMMQSDVKFNFSPMMNVRKLKTSQSGGKLWLHCPTCPRSFLTITSLQRHIVIHTNVRPHKCSLCISTYRLPSALREHMKVKHSVKFKGNTNEILDSIELSENDNATSLQSCGFTPNIQIELLKKKAKRTIHQEEPRESLITFKHSSDIVNQWAESTDTLEMTDPKKLGFSMPDLSDSKDADAPDCNKTKTNVNNALSNSEETIHTINAEFMYDSQPLDTPASSVLNSFINADDNTMNSVGGQTLFSDSMSIFNRTTYLTNATDMTADIGTGDILNTEEPNILTFEQVQSFINIEPIVNNNIKTCVKDLIYDAEDAPLTRYCIPDDVSLTDAPNNISGTVDKSDSTKVIDCTSDKSSTNCLLSIDSTNMISPFVLPDATVKNIGVTGISPSDELDEESIIHNTVITGAELSDLSLDHMISTVINTNIEMISIPHVMDLSEADLHTGSITMYSVPDSEIVTANTPEPFYDGLVDRDSMKSTVMTEDQNFESVDMMSINISSEQIVAADTHNVELRNLESTLANIVEETFLPNADSEIPVQQIDKIIDELVNETESPGENGILQMTAENLLKHGEEHTFDIGEFAMESYAETNDALADLMQPSAKWKRWQQKPRHRHMCVCCPASFYRPSDLQRHTHAVHDALRPHVCPHCTRPFSKLSALRVHQDTQHAQGERQNIPCHICGKKIKHKNNLHVHLRLHQNKPFKCYAPACPKLFQTKANRDQHMIKHIYKEPKKTPLPDMLSDLLVEVVENVGTCSQEQTLPTFPEVAAARNLDVDMDSSQMPPPYRPFKVYMCQYCKVVFRYKKLASRHKCAKNKICVCTALPAALPPSHSQVHQVQTHQNTQ